jgi:hypothetical protein
MGDFKLLGVSENFVVVASKRDCNRLIETYRLCDGETEHELDLTDHFWRLVSLSKIKNPFFQIQKYTSRWWVTTYTTTTYGII